MAKKKIVMTEGKRNIIASLLQEYDIKTAEGSGAINLSVRYHRIKSNVRSVKYATKLL